VVGARWSLSGAEAILRLRALRASGDFDAYWEFILRRTIAELTRHAMPTARSPIRCH
jgi:hypothetical protein